MVPGPWHFEKYPGALWWAFFIPWHPTVNRGRHPLLTIGCQGIKKAHQRAPGYFSKCQGPGTMPFWHYKYCKIRVIATLQSARVYNSNSTGCQGIH